MNRGCIIFSFRKGYFAAAVAENLILHATKKGINGQRGIFVVAAPVWPCPRCEKRFKIDDAETIVLRISNFNVLPNGDDKKLH
jgi:hypothetical protein